jgi:hypothetical protein
VEDEVANADAREHLKDSLANPHEEILSAGFPLAGFRQGHLANHVGALFAEILEE